MKKTSVRQCFLGVLVILLLSGCADLGGMNQFVFKDQKALAQQKWDSVRCDVKLQLVRQHLEAGRLAEAEKLLEQIIAVSPFDARPYVLVTRLRLEQGKLAEAKEAIATAQGMSGADAETFYYAGIVAQRYGDHAAALKHYQTASLAAPLVPAYVAAQAETLLALDQPSDALQLITQRLSDFDGDVPLRVLAARIARRLELRGAAITYARDAIQLGKDDRILTMQMAELLEWAGADETVIDLLTPLLHQTPELPTSMKCLLAQACARTDRTAQADEILRSIANEAGSAGIIAMISARAAMDRGNFQDAANIAQRAILDAETHGSAEPLLITGLWAFKSGKFNEALSLMRKALEFDPQNISVLCLKGQVHESLGQRDEARQSYLQAREIAPHESTPKLLLENLTRRSRKNQTPIDTQNNPLLQSASICPGDLDEPCASPTEGP